MIIRFSIFSMMFSEVCEINLLIKVQNHPVSYILLYTKTDTMQKSGPVSLSLFVASLV